MRAAMREVLPPRWSLCLAAFMIAAPQLAMWTLEYWVTGSIKWDSESPDEPRASMAILVISAGMYGGFRMVAFHPFYREAFRRWLTSTPWTSSQRLPFGQVNFVWQDLVVVVVALVLSYYFVASPPVSIEMVITLFAQVGFAMVGVWCVMVAITLVEHELRIFLYTMLFGAGLMMRLADSPAAVGGTLLGIYVVGMFGVRRTLDRLRSNEEPSNQEWSGKQWFAMAQDPEQQSGATWPYRLVGPLESRLTMPWRDGLVLSLLAGWGLYVVIGRILATVLSIEVYAGATLPERDLWQRLDVNGDSGLGLATLWPLYLIILFAFIRIVRYCADYWSPISLWGRLWTGRWIVPGYDRVLVVPCLALVVGGLGPTLCWRVGWLPSIYLPVIFACAMAIILCGGPRFRNWRLTGHFRVRPGWISSSSRTNSKTLVGAG